ncbi:MAG: double-strand break repair helicase AddA [Pseudomonadota bacterium]
MSKPDFPSETPAFLAAANAQFLAADPFRSAWVAANAGSGKTKVLIDRVARLLLRDAAPDAILCITFTRAAANEMISRLFKRLGDWSVMDDAPLAKELASLEGREAAGFSDGELRKARALFAKALETPGGLRIETIHAFCARLLRRFPLEAGIMPGFRDLDEADAHRLTQAARRKAVLKLAQTAPACLDALAMEGGGHGIDAALDLASALNRHTPNAADTDMAALRDVLGAPAQTPKDVLDEALEAALPKEAYRSAIAALAKGASTDQALAERLEDALNEPDLMRRFEHLQGVWLTTSGGLRKSNPFTKSAPDFVAELFSVKPPEGREITRLKQVETDVYAAEALARTAALHQLARPLGEAYAAGKAAAGALDFDDLIDASHRLLIRAGVADWVRYKMDGGLAHVLLDEAQDTSPAQWDILRALTEEFFAGQGAEKRADPRTYFVVGDEKQSIYAFQGADPRLFLSGKRDFIERTLGEGHTPDMLMSFRSSPEVLAAVDAVMASAALDVPTSLSQPPLEADLPRHTARRANQPGRVELWPIEEKPAPEAADAWDAPVDAQGVGSPKALLATQVVETISTMIDRGDTVWAPQSDGSWAQRAVEPGDFLILVRKRGGGLFDAVIENLKRNDLPAAGADRLVLTQHIAVQDALNTLRFALTPSDDLTLGEILRGPFCDLVDDDVHLFPLAYKRSADETLWDRLQASDDPRHSAALEFLSGLLERTEWQAFEFLCAVLDGKVLGDETGWDRIGARLGDPARDPIEALCSRALAHDRDGGTGLQSFLSAMESDESEIKRDLAEAGGAVRVMTVHGAKGLQAPVVILPDTTGGPANRGQALLTLPGGLTAWAPSSKRDTPKLAAARAEADARISEEHVRLLYVAMTRAQDRLIVCGHWHGKAQPGYHKASWYALCRAGLEAAGAMVEPESGILALGSPPPAGARRYGDDAALPDAPAWLRRPAPVGGRGPRALSPSQLFSERAQILDPLAAQDKDRRLRGRLIHKLLEQLSRLPETERSAAARTIAAREARLDEAARNEAAETALATLSDPELAEVFSDAGRAEAPIVGAGTGWPDGTLINGRVDRLVISKGRVLIADIKTDRPPPARPEMVDRAYLAQMAAYQNVLETTFPGREIKCVLVWTDGPRLMDLPDPLLLDALKRAQRSL